MHVPAPPVVVAAAGVIAAAMDSGATPAEIAAAEESAGLLTDPQRAQDIADAYREQAYAEFRVDLATAVQAGTEVEDRQSLAYFHERARAVAQLCDGRPHDHLLSVYEVEAALNGVTPTQMPLTITWDGQITGPDGDGPGEATLIRCTTSRGGKAVIALSPEERLVLGAQLLATRHSAEACTRSGCGTPAEDLDASDPKLWGWIAVDVAGVDGGARWWCSPLCVNVAMAAAVTELAEADQAAAVDSDTQGEPDYLDTRYGVGASDEHALQVAEAHEAAVEDERGDVEDGAR